MSQSLSARSPTDAGRPRTPPSGGFLSVPQAVHFVGIGGSGMSGLAECLLRCGFPVSGSDVSASEALDRLAGQGAKVSVGHAAANIPAGTRLLVHTLAVGADNPEMARAAQQGIPVIRYAELLGKVMADRYGIAVSGCHGKTTTTAMIAHALHALGHDPSFVVGGVLTGFQASSRIGDGPHFVAEACEYARSFHHLHARIAVVTNVEADHLDYYRDLDEIVDAFAQFLAMVPREGRIVFNGDDADARRAVKIAVERLKAPALPISFGRATGNDWRFTDAETAEGRACAVLAGPGQPNVPLRLSLPGIHNLWNATACVTALAQAGIPPVEVARSLETFTGVARRMQRLAERNGSVLMDDYAHHPTEINAVLQAARRMPGVERIVAVYQPHQHGRTRRHLHEFGAVLRQADLVLIPNIFSARETEAEIRGISVGDLVQEIARQGAAVEHVAETDAIVRRVAGVLRPGTLVVTMGAGDVWKVAEALRRSLFA